MGVACEESSGTDVCKVEFECVAYGISHSERISRQAGVTTSRSISMNPSVQWRRAARNLDMLEMQLQPWILYILNECYDFMPVSDYLIYVHTWYDFFCEPLSGIGYKPQLEVKRLGTSAKSVSYKLERKLIKSRLWFSDSSKTERKREKKTVSLSHSISYSRI